MKWNQTLLYFILIILKWKIVELFRTDIRCWFGHKYVDTKEINVKKCKRCGVITLFIKAVYEHDEMK